MAVIELKNIGKSYDKGKSFVIENMNLEVEDREFVVILGPSGCGKSTTLRMIAGIEGISTGELWMDGKKVNDLPSKDRDIAMVFQNYALFPHMSVANNIAFALKINKVKKDEITKRVNQAAKVLGLEEFLDRKPGALSGGQQQRVALGRAMVNDSKFFLMDEPLSNLDANLRTQMREEILALHSRLGTTTVFVTHDQVEAMTMATKIVVLNQGKVMQVGSPSEIYDQPANYFVANFIGNPKMNFMLANVDNQVLSLENGQVIGRVSAECTQHKVRIGIRPEHVHVCDFNQGILSGDISFTEMLGSDLNLFVETECGKVTVKTARHKEYQVGEPIELDFELDKIHLFEIETGEVIKAEMSEYHE